MNHYACLPSIPLLVLEGKKCTEQERNPTEHAVVTVVKQQQLRSFKSHKIHQQWNPDSEPTNPPPDLAQLVCTLTKYKENKNYEIKKMVLLGLAFV